jgi:hypothetical protein
MEQRPIPPPLRPLTPEPPDSATRSLLPLPSLVVPPHLLEGIPRSPRVVSRRLLACRRPRRSRSL